MILGVAALADALASLSMEVDRGGVEEYQIQSGEQIPSLGEQLLFDEVFGGSRHERCRALLLVFGQRFSQPGHGSVEMMQSQFTGALDGIVLLPFFRGAITAR